MSVTKEVLSEGSEPYNARYEFRKGNENFPDENAVITVGGYNGKSMAMIFKGDLANDVIFSISQELEKKQKNGDIITDDAIKQKIESVIKGSELGGKINNLKINLPDKNAKGSNYKLSIALDYKDGKQPSEHDVLALQDILAKEEIITFSVYNELNKGIIEQNEITNHTNIEHYQNEKRNEIHISAKATSIGRKIEIRTSPISKEFVIEVHQLESTNSLQKVYDHLAGQGLKVSVIGGVDDNGKFNNEKGEFLRTGGYIITVDENPEKIFEALGKNIPKNGPMILETDAKTLANFAKTQDGFRNPIRDVMSNLETAGISLDNNEHCGGLRVTAKQERVR